MDEKQFGTKLSYRTMMSVPGINYNDIQKKFNFRDKLNLIEKLDKNLYTPIFNDLFIILSSNNSNKINIVEKILTEHPDTTIYPSYYFNPNCYIHQKNLLKNSICINLWKIKSDNTNIKTEIKRNYKITPMGIISKLNENPKDKLRNIRKI